MKNQAGSNLKTKDKRIRIRDSRHYEKIIMKIN